VSHGGNLSPPPFHWFYYAGNAGGRSKVLKGGKRDNSVTESNTLHDWTDGCIAVTNQEMDELWKLVRVGTPIDIKP
jgi:hypothetical protein